MAHKMGQKSGNLGICENTLWAGHKYWKYVSQKNNDFEIQLWHQYSKHLVDGLRDTNPLLCKKKRSNLRQLSQYCQENIQIKHST